MKKFILTVTLIVLLMTCTTVISGALDVEIDVGDLMTPPSVTTTSSATVSQDMIGFHIEFSEIMSYEFVSIAVYEDSGRMVDYVIVPSLYGETNTDIYIPDIETATEARVFVMNDKVQYQPISEAELIDIRR